MEYSDLFKLLMAVGVGGLIGAEREFRDKSAGFRTIIFICVGAALFTIFSQYLGEGGDEARIAAQIVTGVGFLGAGAIMRDAGGHVAGLTTAATIWLAAALGMGIGGGYYLYVSVVTVVVLLVLMLFPTVERWIDNVRDFRTYQVVAAPSPQHFGELEALFGACGLRIVDRKRVKTGGDMVCTWYTFGRPKQHQLMTDKLFEHPDVKSFNIMM